MIPKAFIIEWSHHVPWQSDEQVEQDLVISRALVELFSDTWIKNSLAFRGGTALYKLWFSPAQRYSEDIDLVQIRAEPIKETILKLQDCLNFLGDPSIEPRKDGLRLIYRFFSESPLKSHLRLKVETNTREHFTVLGYHEVPYSVNSSWFTENCNTLTYRPEELLGTKLRALYQRRKGRDLFDLYTALVLKPDLDKNALLECYRVYIRHSVEHPPTRKQFIINLKDKMQDPEFLGDITALLRPGIIYDPVIACELIKSELIEKI